MCLLIVPSAAEPAFFGVELGVTLRGVWLDSVGGSEEASGEACCTFFGGSGIGAARMIGAVALHASECTAKYFQLLVMVTALGVGLSVGQRLKAKIQSAMRFTKGMMKNRHHAA